MIVMTLYDIFRLKSLLILIVTRWIFGSVSSCSKIEEIMTSIDVVFAHFSQPDGFRAERLGDAMRVLGMNPTEEEDGHGCDFRGRLGWPLEFSSRKLASPCPMCLFAFFAFLFRSAIRSASTWQILEGPSTLTKGRFTISSRTQGLGLVPCLAKFHDVSRRVFVKVCLMLLPFPWFLDFNDLHRFFLFFYCKLQHHGTTQDELIKHFEKVQARWWQHRAQFHVSVYILLLDSDSLVQFCAGSGWLFEAIWQGRQRCLVQGRIARSDARRGVRFVEFPWDGLSWSTFGRNSEGTRKELGRSVDSRVLGRSVGVPATCVQEESARKLQVGVARKRPEIFKFPKPTNWKKTCFTCHSFRVSSSSEIQTLKSTAFSLLYTCKTTLCLVFAVVQWVVLFLCVTLDSPRMVFLTFLPMYNLQSHIDSLACVARQVSQRCRATATWMQTATW